MIKRRHLSLIVFLLCIIISCKTDTWETEHMRTGAILQFTTNGKLTKNYEAQFYEGRLNSVSSDMALGIKDTGLKLFRRQSGNDGKSENLWLPIGTITVIVINRDTKSFAYKVFDSKFDSYAILTTDFVNTVDCGCKKLYREDWVLPVTYVH